jgi:hypothetical protein
MNRSKWKQLEVEWWPSNTDEFTDKKFLHQEYKNLLIKDSKNIFITILGKIEQNRYKFDVETTFGKLTHITTISGSDKGFPIDYKKID